MFFNKLYTAIEIDYDRFKILEVIKKQHGYSLNNFVNVKLPDTGNADIGTIASKLNGLMAEHRISGKNVFTNINSNAVYSYNIYLPDMPKNDLDKAVEYEIKKLIPFPLSSCIFDYIFTKTDSNLSITAFVSKTEDINNFKKIFTRAGIKLKSIECKTVSIYNNILLLSNNKIEHLLLCDINDTTAQIVIIRENMVSFERAIEGINLKDAEQNDPAALIGDELKKTMDFYFAGKSFAPIDGIILTGSYAGNKDFKDKITEITGLKTYFMSIINQLMEEKKYFSLSKRLMKFKMDKNYDFFKPLEEMWTTIGLISGR